jgi:succinoglycan biosynthesis protein ExoU
MSTNESGVCVIVAAFNAQETIGRAVKSALLQDHVHEVIVADDASQDDTADRARAHDDGSGRLAVITLAENKGPAVARNAALERSNSPYVCTLDADDYFLPERISGLLTAASTTSWDMVADDILIVPENQQHIEFSIVSSGSPRRCKTLDLESFVRGNISHPQRPRDELGFLKPIIKRSFLHQHNLHYDERLRLGEDYALYTRALIAGARFCLASACGYVAIERNSSISSLHSASDLKRIAAFDAACLKNDLSLSSGERTALAAHRAATIRKYDYRTVLDHKRDHGFLAALALLATMPASVSYVAAQTIQAKTTRSFGSGSRRDDNAKKPGFRFLVGMPETQLSLSGPE